jgi:hypothetical protein
MRSMRNFALALCALVACGDDGGNNKMIDSGVSSIDSQEQDIDAAVPTAVKITVSSSGTKLAGVRVHFQNPDSTLVTSADTDANGVASADMPLGGYVTAVDPFLNAPPGIGTFVQLRTFAGVKAGDELVLTEDPRGVVTQVLVEAPIDTDALVDSYYFATPCDSNSTPKPGDASNPSVSLDLYGACMTSTDVVIASLDANGEPLHWLYAQNIAQASNSIDLSGMTLVTAPTSKSYTFSNIPVAVGGVTLDQQLASAKGVIIDRSTDLAGPTATHTWMLPGFTGAIDLVLGFMNMASGLGSQNVVDWGPFSATYSTDVGARLLVEPTTPASFDTTTHQVKWTADTTGVAPDFAMATATADRVTSSLQIEWQVSAVYNGGVVQFPTLPVENGKDYNFALTDTTSVDQVVLGKVTGGYDAVREIIQSLAGPQDIAASGATGAMTFEEFSDQALRRVGPVSRGKFLQKPVAPTWKFRRRM